MDDPLPGRYEYHDDAGCTIGTVTVWEDDLPADIGRVYRVTTTDDGEVIDLRWEGEYGG